MQVEIIDGVPKEGTWWGPSILVPDESGIYHYVVDKKWFAVPSDGCFYTKGKDGKWEYYFDYDPEKVVA